MRSSECLDIEPSEKVALPERNSNGVVSVAPSQRLSGQRQNMADENNWQNMAEKKTGLRSFRGFAFSNSQHEVPMKLRYGPVHC